ncbi:ABC-type Fe3+ transport system, permease component [Leptolyngbyaceae cyanobacterium JSC-12]|nr:ABC-type Fe3+ transport system, permease component [Leptolyngbyaceae cyanobacterium JSC-12]
MAWAIAALIAAPVLVILAGIFTNSVDTWNHLAATVLPAYITNSLLLMVGVGVGVLLVGVSTAWLITMCRFPGQQVFEWALLLPLAAPAYLLAYVYTEWLAFYGPVQTTLRDWFGWESVQDYWFPNVRSLWGAVFMLVLTLYPYVYLLARTAFLAQSTCTLEASRNLGCNPWRSFLTVALPLARPAIMAGLSLALMETLNDFGTVQHFGVDTFTTGIYRTWFGMGERPAATQLSAMLLLFVLGLILVERWSRGRAKFYQTANTIHQLSSYRLGGVRAIAAFFTCLLPIFLGLLIPGGLLLKMVLEPAASSDSDAESDYGSSEFVAANTNEQFWSFASHSFTLALATAAIAVVLSILLAYGLRLFPKPAIRLATQVAVMGYAVPGSVIAVGILVPLGLVDNAVDSWTRSTFGFSTGLLFSGTITALVYAYLVRFLAVSFSSVDASLASIKPSLDDAARSLGHTPTSTLFRVHAPLMWSGILTAAMLVFVDVMKELPATLIVRPFNFDTLAVRVYNLASDERLREAAAPALAIILVGLVPVILLSWQITRSRQRHDYSSSQP